MEFALACLFIGVYFLLEFLMIREQLDLHWALILISFFILAVTSLAYPGQIAWSDWTNVVSGGIGTYSAMMLTFVMYGVFGAILYEFGVVSTMVKYALEISKGRNPAVIMIVFSLVGTFASLGGGSFVVYMIGTELFMALGLKPHVAAGLSVQSACAGYFLTVTYYPFIAATTGVTQLELLPQALIVTAVLIATDMAAIWTACKQYHPVPSREKIDALTDKYAQTDIKKFTFCLPLLPVVLILVLKMDAMFSFILCDAATILCCQLCRKYSMRELAALCTRAFRKGVNDAAGFITMLLCVGILVTCINLAPVKSLFVCFMNTVMPGGKLGLLAVLLILCTVGVPYRGIGQPMGMGIGIFVALMALPGISPMFVAVVMLVLCASSLLIDPISGSAMICQSFTGAKGKDYLFWQLKINIIPLTALLIWCVCAYSAG